MNIFFIVEIVVSMFLITLILLQAQGSGVGKTFGGGGEFYRSRRGIEKLLFRATIATTIIFAIISVLAVIFAKG